MKIWFFVLIIFTLLIGFVCADSPVTLTWVAPTTATDGTATTLAGFNLYRGSASGKYDQPKLSIPLSSCMGASCIYTYTVPVGTWFWVVTAVDSYGQESTYSNEVTKTIAAPLPAPPSGCSLLKVN